MKLQIQNELDKVKKRDKNEPKKLNSKIFSKGYVEFLNEAGWRLVKKLPSNYSNYSDLLEDTDWKHNNNDLKTLKHYRRDLDPLS